MNEVLEPQRDANGIPILPGYRKPFTSETARAAGAKYRQQLKTQKELVQKFFKLPTTELKPQAFLTRLNAIRTAFNRHLKASHQATNGNDGLNYAKAARECLAIEKELLGSSQPSLVATKPKPPQSQPRKAVKKSPTIDPGATDQNAPQVKPEAKSGSATLDEGAICPNEHSGNAPNKTLPTSV